MSDRCKPHGARACRRCETGHLGAAIARAAENHVERPCEKCQSEGPLEGCHGWCEWCDESWPCDASVLGAALSSERAAHATTKAELERAEKDSIIYADKFESATARAASEFKRANDNAEKLRATRERAEAAEAKVARVEALAAYWELTDESGWHEVRAALAGDGDD